MSNYFKWQKRGKNGYFIKKIKVGNIKVILIEIMIINEFFSLEHTENYNECWNKYEGERAEYYIFPEWTGMFWKCDYCTYKSKNFQDFILKIMGKNNTT